MAIDQNPLEEIQTFLKEEFTRIRHGFDMLKDGDTCEMNQELVMGLSLQVKEAIHLARLPSSKFRKKPYYNALRWAYASRSPMNALGCWCRCESCRKKRRIDFNRASPVLAKRILKAFYKWDSSFFKELAGAMDAVSKDDHYLAFSYSNCEFKTLTGKEYLETIGLAFFFLTNEHKRLPTAQEWKERSDQIYWENNDGETIHSQLWSRAYDLLQMKHLEKGEEKRGRPEEKIGESTDIY